MRSIYEASSSVEAHMIKSLLHINEIDSEIFGDHLQGGVGELQAIGTVRVMVSDNDVEAAHKIIQEWEASQPPVVVATEDQSVKKGGGLGAAIVGFIAGAAAVLLYLQSTVEHEGFDYNKDGKLDVQNRYINDTIRSSKSDRNLDGEFDELFRYAFDGRLESASFDEDFDGRYETRCSYRFNQPLKCESDADGDEFYEYHENYQHGVLESTALFNPENKKVIKRDFVKFGRVIRTEIDSDGDSKFDTQ